MFNVQADCEYGDAIRQFFQAQFPLNTTKNQGDVLELVMDAVIASGKIRLGPKPSIESLYAIRQHLAAQIAAGAPIQLLTPWGSEKPASMQGVDLAEVAGLKTLACLHNRVKQVYSPGVKIRIRVEDASAPDLFRDRKEQARMDALIYTQSFVSLINVLEMDSFIEAVPESTLITEEVNHDELIKIVPLMTAYLTESDEALEEYVKRDECFPALTDMASYKPLAAAGWTGFIHPDQRDYYRSMYRRLYGMNDEQATETLAIYLSQALVRFRMKSTGSKDWTDFLGLAFNPPVPGEPVARNAKRIYYRTLPENISSLHMPPWRAKGYFAFSNDGARPRLASWQEQRSYTSNTVTLTSESHSVVVRCDYEVS